MLGFDWAEVPDVKSSAFGFMIVVVKGRTVTDHYVEWDSGSYFDPCTSADGKTGWGGVSSYTETGDHTMDFEYSRSFMRWFRE